MPSAKNLPIRLRKDFTKSTVIQLMLFAGAFRIMLGVMLGSWIDGTQYWDEALMIHYADFGNHFGNPYVGSVVKYMGYPLFLWLMKWIPLIPYTAWVSILWIAAGILAYLVCVRIGMSRKAAFFFFVYFLFLPEAFGKDSGTRIYRNAIIGPFTLLSFSLMILLGLYIRDYAEHKKKCMLLAALTGILTAYTGYIKEDGVWIWACLIFATVIYAAEAFWLHRKNGETDKNAKTEIKADGKTKSVWVCCFLPLLCVALISLGYRAVNDKYFGVFETNTRTAGQTGKFIQYVYRIASDDRSSNIWAPKDAIDKAFAASPTLSKEGELLEAIHTSAWVQGNIDEHPIGGDFLGWVLLTEYDKVFEWDGEDKKEAFFGQVNREIREAFQNGTLKKEKGRIMLLPSAGSKSLEEIKDMQKQVAAAYRSAVLLAGYEAAIVETELPETMEAFRATENAAKITHQAYLEDYSRISEISGKASVVCTGIFWIYRVVNVLLLLGTVINFLVIIIKTVCRQKNSALCVVSSLMSLLFLGISFAYDFSISWFSTFLHGDGVNLYWTNYYMVALPVILGLAYCFGWNSLLDRKDMN